VCRDCARAYRKGRAAADPSWQRLRSQRNRDANGEGINRAARERYHGNREKEIARSHTYRLLNYEKSLATQRGWRERNKEKANASSRRRKRETAEVIRPKNAAYRAANKDKVKARNKVYRKLNAERIRVYNADYVRRNRPAVIARTAARYAAKLHATPRWADLKAVKAFYVEAARLTGETGVAHEVDHIVPLQSAIVCGLHWEGNLQILTRVENRQKGARLAA
jgi:hypothetical protein